MRQVVSLSTDITLDSYLVSFIRLNHVIAGIYMCVYIRGQLLSFFHQAESCHSWHLHVCLYSWKGTSLANIELQQRQLGNCDHDWL